MKVLGWYAVALVVIALDQYTKGLAQAMLDYGRPVEILPVLNFTCSSIPGRRSAFSVTRVVGSVISSAALLLSSAPC